jgi:hypothetical protein
MGQITGSILSNGRYQVMAAAGDKHVLAKHRLYALLDASPVAKRTICE